MSADADYEDADVRSDDDEVEKDEDASHEERSDDEDDEEAEEGRAGEKSGEEEDEDFDVLDDTAPPKPLPRTITLLLPRPQKPGDAAAAREPTCVHVCLTRGMMGRLPKQRANATPGDAEEEEEEEEDNSQDAATHGNAAAAGAEVDADEEDEEEDEEDAAATTAARLQGCCAEGHHYQLDYAAPLAAQRRRIILRHLHGDADRQRRFLLAERQREAKAAATAGDGDDGDDADAAGAGGEGDGGADAAGAAAAGPVDGVVWPWTGVQQPPPYWLPSLLSNDAATLQRVLHIMYGWVIAPDPHPADHLKLDAAGRLGTGTPNPEGEEDDEDAEQADPAHHNPDFFLASGAFRGEEDEEEAGGEGGAAGDERESNTSSNRESAAPAGAASKSLMDAFNDADGDGDEEEEVEDAPHHSDDDTHMRQADRATVNGPGRSHALLSTVTAPPPVVELPYFPFADYEFFIVYDADSEEWHLLDTHPVFVMQACRRRRAAAGGGGGGGAVVDVEAAEPDAEDGGDDGSHRGDGSDAERDEEAAETPAGSAFPVPRYALDTLVPVSPVVLAALFSPAALRCCLLQPLHDPAGAAGDDTGASEEDEDGGKPAAPTRGVAPHAVLRSFDEAWLAVDVPVAVPILATICRVRQRVLQQDTVRIPYALGSLWLDFNPLLTQPGFADVTVMASAEEAARWRAAPGQSAEEAEDLEDAAAAGFGVSAPSSPVQALPELATPHRWGAALDSLVNPNHHGRLVLAALLDAGVLPTRPVEASLFVDLGLVRLVLWLWMRLPAKLIRRWGSRSAADAGAAAADDDDDDDADAAHGQDEDAEEEEDDEAGVEAEMESMTTEDVTDFIRQRVEKMAEHAAGVRRRQLRRHHPTLCLAPLLQRVVLELQRRLDRVNAVDTRGAALAPSQYTLHESVAHTFAVDRLESGRPRQDPLVTTAFVGLGTPAAGGDSSEAPGTAPAVPGLVRHQRLYQSDLVLLLLALTTTPAPPPSRATVMLELAEKRFSSAADTSGNLDDGAGGAAVVSVKETELGDMDGHLGLFAQLLEAKTMRCVRRPQDRARAGTVKLLLLCAADFCRGATRHCVFNQLPAFELFGSTGYCPLQELVQAWACACSSAPNTGEARKMTATMELFAYFTWSEIRWRLRKGQYKDADVARMRAQLPDLFALVESHTSTYNAILAHLDAEATSDSELDGSGGEAPSLAASMTAHSAGPAASKMQRHRPSLVSSAVLRATRDEERDAADVAHATAGAVSRHSTPSPPVSSPLGPVAGGTAAAAASCAAAAGAGVSRPLTLAHPNAYSADVLEAKTGVSELWASFAVAPRTYMTAETLHALLFGRDRSGDADDADDEDDGDSAADEPRRFHLAALRVMFEHGVTTVQACPLEGTEVPAVEAALQRADLAAVKVLLGLGAASLQDTRQHGSATLESWAETLFSAADMAVLRFVAQRNGKAMRADPRLQFGARRFHNAIAQS